MKNQIRIIAGRFRGRKIEFPEIENLRPTADRIRETLFNWLRTNIIGARCLDLFSGSGALCFEAISRGAQFVLALEKNKQAYLALKENAEKLNMVLENGFINNSEKQPCSIKNPKYVIEEANFIPLLEDTNLWLKKTWEDKPFDIVFMDPPFKESTARFHEGDNYLKNCLMNLKQGNFLARDAVIYVESPEKIDLETVEPYFNIAKQEKAGKVHFTLLYFKEQS